MERFLNLAVTLDDVKERKIYLSRYNDCMTQKIECLELEISYLRICFSHYLHCHTPDAKRGNSPETFKRKQIRKVQADTKLSEHLKEEEVCKPSECKVEYAAGTVSDDRAHISVHTIHDYLQSSKGLIPNRLKELQVADIANLRKSHQSEVHFHTVIRDKHIYTSAILPTLKRIYVNKVDIGTIFREQLSAITCLLYDASCDCRIYHISSDSKYFTMVGNSYKRMLLKQIRANGDQYKNLDIVHILSTLLGGVSLMSHTHPDIVTLSRKYIIHNELDEGDVKSGWRLYVSDISIPELSRAYSKT